MAETPNRHFVSMVTAIVGLLTTAAGFLLQGYLPQPYGVPLWIILLASVLVVAPLRFIAEMRSG